MKLYTELVAWSGYAGYVVAEYTVELRRASKTLRRIADEFTILRKAKTVSETKALVQQEPEYQRAEDKVEAVEDKKLLAESIYTDLDKSASTVSRELTRRTSRGSLEGRNDKYTT